MRLFLDTHKSGVKIGYRVLDDKKRVVYENIAEEESTENEVIHLLLNQVESSHPEENPYTLEIHYHFDNQTLSNGKCSYVEISMIV